MFTFSSSCWSCDLCGGQQYHIPESMNFYLQTEEENALICCSNCSLLSRKSLPEKKHVNKELLQKKGFVSLSGYAGGTNTANPRMKKRLQVYLQKCQRKVRFLDVGCGTGSVVQYAQDIGWESFGTELSSHKWSKKKDMSNILYLDICRESHELLAKDSFFFVHLNHVLEHAPSPRELLKASYEYVEPGGYLCMEVPNELQSLTAKIRLFLRRKYRSKTAYFGHRYFFTKPTFYRLAKTVRSAHVTMRTPAIYNGFFPLHKQLFGYFQSIFGQGSVIEIILKKPNASSS